MIDAHARVHSHAYARDRHTTSYEFRRSMSDMYVSNNKGVIARRCNNVWRGAKRGMPGRRPPDRLRSDEHAEFRRIVSLVALACCVRMCAASVCVCGGGGVTRVTWRRGSRRVECGSAVVWKKKSWRKKLRPPLESSARPPHAHRHHRAKRMRAEGRRR